jgi:hypothetical protein
MELLKRHTYSEHHNKIFRPQKLSKKETKGDRSDDIMMSEFLLEVIREVIQRIIVVIILMCIWAVLEFELRALHLHEALHQLEL